MIAFIRLKFRPHEGKHLQFTLCQRCMVFSRFCPQNPLGFPPIPPDCERSIFALKGSAAQEVVNNVRTQFLVLRWGCCTMSTMCYYAYIDILYLYIYIYVYAVLQYFNVTHTYWSIL